MGSEYTKAGILVNSAPVLSSIDKILTVTVFFLGIRSLGSPNLQIYEKRGEPGGLT